MMVYYTNVEEVKELSDLVIDTQGYWDVETLSSPSSDITLRSTFSDSGIAWVTKNENVINFRMIGSSKERYEPRVSGYVQCRPQSLTFDPNAKQCIVYQNLD